METFQFFTQIAPTWMGKACSDTAAQLLIQSFANSHRICQLFIQRLWMSTRTTSFQYYSFFFSFQNSTNKQSVLENHTQLHVHETNGKTSFSTVIIPHCISSFFPSLFTTYTAQPEHTSTILSLSSCIQFRMKWKSSHFSFHRNFHFNIKKHHHTP